MRNSLAAVHISLREFKTRNRRAVALADEPFRVLAEMPHREGFVFPWRDRKQVYRLWNPCCEAAGLIDLHPHDMRHTYATWLRKYAGLDQRALMAAGGWRDTKSVARYSHVTADEVMAAVQRLPKISAKNA